MAYPIARPLRTASSLAMYSLIIFSLAFMSVMSNGIGNQAGDLAEGSAAGHDILVNANQSNPISTDALAAVDGVGVVNPIVRGWAQWSAEAQPDELEEWGLSGISPTFAEVGSLKLMTRAERFASDAEAFAAVAADPTLVIVPQWFMNVDSDVWSLPVGSQITAEDGPDKPSYEVVGVIEEDWGGAGLVMSVEGAQRAAPHADVRRFYVKAAEGADGRAVAERIETTFITNGAYAETFVDRVNGWIETDLGFFRLLQGYLQLGLVIGIAGLAVTLFRAVRERRRQIGMMRAMGLPAGGIRQWFLTESTFVSLMGIVTGVSLGVLTSWLMIAKSEAFEGGRLPFGIPWVSLVVIIAIPFVASGLASIIPARRAAALLPSEALRLAD